MSWQNWVISTLLRYRIKPLARQGLSVAKVRAATGRPARPAKVPEGWRITLSMSLPLRGEWTERDDGVQPERMLLYFHGGGYFFCSPETHRPITLALAAGAEARVFSLDYRLAPENRFPAAIEDAVAAYRALLAQGVPPNRLVLAGDSAGGGLALATLLTLREEGDEMPAGAILFSPWTDLTGSGETLTTNDKSDVMFTGMGLLAGARHYLGGARSVDPLASPLLADLSGLPPLFIQASSTEVLLSDSTRLADKARAAGTDADLHIWPGLPHVWQLFTPFLPEARRALVDAEAFVRRVAA